MYLSNETIIMILGISLFCYIASKFSNNIIFDFFKSTKTGKFNLWSALMMGTIIDFLVGLILMIFLGE